MKKIIALSVIAAATLVGGCSANSHDSDQQIAACIKALDASEDVADGLTNVTVEFSNHLGFDQELFQDVLNADAQELYASRLRNTVAVLEVQSEKVNKARTEYMIAEKECRGNR